MFGSGLTLGGVWLTARQRERADLRDAWLKQLALALGELAQGADPGRRFVGRAILESLMVDDGAPAAYRELAKKILTDNRGPFERSAHRDLDGPRTTRDNDEDRGGA